MKLLLVCNHDDMPYLARLKDCIGGAQCAVVNQTPDTLSELGMIMREKGATAIISTSEKLLHKLVPVEGRRKPSIDNYAGSLFTTPKIPGAEIVFLHPLEQLISVSHGKFLARRYISKLVSPHLWRKELPFQWSLYDPATVSSIYDSFATADLLAIDIETFSDPLSIRCVGYTAVWFDTGLSQSIVIPCDNMVALSWIRRLNDLPMPKIFQNGKYDISYLSRYDAAPINYLYDTAEMMHSWYSELPKDLASLNSFFVRESMYWKDLAATNDLYQYYLYNAKDTWATANVALAWMNEAPQWAKDNYANTFPLQFPCHLSEMTGIQRDMEEIVKSEKKYSEEITSETASLSKILGVREFNTNSPVQMKELLKILGCGDLPSADAKNLAKASLRHPLNSHIIGRVLSIRKKRKLLSTYLTPGKEFTYHGKSRILYTLNPHGTDTGRLASKEHHFWCGLQIQNIPRGSIVKRTFIADDGFVIAECDLEQAESRDTAHIAGDESLIVAVSGSRDFHSVNASAFFGIPYDSIYDDAKGKTKDKILRDLAKRVNHGANYNMGPGVLIETMGEDKVWEAKRLLKLPRLWSAKDVAEHLLAQFHKTYPAISHVYYPGVIYEVETTHCITSKAIHSVSYQAAPESPLVRYCFGDPGKNKSDLNAYVAHPPQSLNAMTLNRAYMKVFYEIAMHRDHRNNFKLLAQIHDSILFQFRVGHEYLMEKVKEAMEIPVTVTAYDGRTRVFTVPAAVKSGKDSRGASNWGETE